MSIGFVVSPTGRDDNPGTAERPFATLARARDALRALRRASKWPRDGVTVELTGGDHVLHESLVLEAEDSGTPEGPVVWRAKLNERVRLLGGRVLTGFTPVHDAAVLARLAPAARAHVVQCDLGAFGITDFGQLRSRGFGRAVTPAHLELFFDGRPMTVARWPNVGEWTRIAAIPDGAGTSDDHGREYGALDAGFHYEGDRPARWAVTDDLWVHGYWAWEWANSYEHVAEIDPARRFLRTAPPHGLYGFRPGQRFHFLNVLEELDEPGEYHVDRRTGMLTFWPPAPIDSAEAVVSVLEQPMIAMRGTRHVVLEGLNLECTRGHGIRIEAGHDCTIRDGVIRHTGNHGVCIEGGFGNAVIGCELVGNGDAGIIIEGGDRATLEPARHRVHHCHLHHQGRWSRCYVPAVSMNGVGMQVTNNLIHDHPHIAILFVGNEHRIEGNEIHHVCLETGDTGAIYTGRDWTYQGNVIRGNYLHDIHEPGWGGSFCIYLDDCVSGITVVDNLVVNANTGVLLGGGRDCMIADNVFVNCAIGVRIDSRGTSKAPVWRDMIYKTMRERLEAMRHREPPYRTRYPGLARLDAYLAGADGVPPGNDAVRRNIASGCKEWLRIGWGATADMLDVRDNIVDSEGEVGFENPADPAAAQFRLRPDSRALAAGFAPIRLADIGLQHGVRASRSDNPVASDGVA